MDLYNRVRFHEIPHGVSGRGRKPFSGIGSGIGSFVGGLFGGGAAAGVAPGAGAPATGQGGSGQGGGSLNPFQGIADAINGFGAGLTQTWNNTISGAENAGFNIGFGIIGVIILIIGILAIVWANTPNEYKGAALAAAAA